MDEFDKGAGYVRSFFRTARSYWRTTVKPWIARVVFHIDAKAESKLGFIAAPVLGWLGGTQAWLLSRGLVALVAAGVAFGVVETQKYKARKALAAKYERMMDEAVAEENKRIEARDKKTQAEIQRVEDSWKEIVNKMSDRNLELEQALAKSTAKVCWTPAVTDALRKKAIQAGKDAK